MNFTDEFSKIKLEQLQELINSSLLFNAAERDQLQELLTKLTDQAKIDKAFNYFFQGEELFLSRELEQVDVVESKKDSYRERLKVLSTIRDSKK
jgi:hypothetical protein